MNTCNECGTTLSPGKPCKAYFDQMIAWDFEDFSGAGKVHHLTVLCYFLQHPSHFSPEGLQGAIGILQKAYEHHFSDRQLYLEESATFSSHNRDWNVTGTPEHHGSYPITVQWSMTVAQVVEGGVQEYPHKVIEWSQSIYADLAKNKLL